MLEMRPSGSRPLVIPSICSVYQRTPEIHRSTLARACLSGLPISQASSRARSSPSRSRASRQLVTRAFRSPGWTDRHAFASEAPCRTARLAASTSSMGRTPRWRPSTGDKIGLPRPGSCQLPSSKLSSSPPAPNAIGATRCTWASSSCQPAPATRIGGSGWFMVLRGDLCGYRRRVLALAREGPPRMLAGSPRPGRRTRPPCVSRMLAMAG